MTCFHILVHVKEMTSGLVLMLQMDAEAEDKTLRTRSKGTKGELASGFQDTMPTTPWNMGVPVLRPWCSLRTIATSAGLVFGNQARTLDHGIERQNIMTQELKDSQKSKCYIMLIFTKCNCQWTWYHAKQHKGYWGKTAPWRPSNYLSDL